MFNKIILRMYLFNYIKKDLDNMNKDRFKIIFIRSFLRGFTFNLIKKKYTCPYCLNEVDEYDYNNHPIYTYGCRKCRERK